MSAEPVPSVTLLSVDTLPPGRDSPEALAALMAFFSAIREEHGLLSEEFQDF